MATTKNDKDQHPPEKDLFPIVAIGASAGGLEAMSELLNHLPTGLNMAYVIIQHLDPNHKSILPELLEKKTDMPVHIVKDGLHVSPDEVYVIPPDTYMSIVDSKLKLGPRVKSDGAYYSIDHFLTALAPVYKNKAIAVILSGTASDGTRGITAIKAEGGITFAQDKSAKYQGMPQSAVNSGQVDFTLSPKGIAKELIRISQHPLRIDSDAGYDPQNEDEIRRILVVLNNKQGTDFSCYKSNMIYRRILRRMVLNRCKNLNAYLLLLRKNDEEAGMLYKDLLINVTGFFRDGNLCRMLTQNLLPKVIKEKKSKDVVRIWVAGCSTGEEAYSLAICVMEYFYQKEISLPLQIFATDLNESAIAKARTGIYPKSALESLSSQRRSRFFKAVDGHYQISKQIRDVCVFAKHDMLKDPPFSHLDIISCHNVLIYFKQEAQKRALQNFHYALNDNRYLLLGRSETTGSAAGFFKLIDKENKIYTKNATTGDLNYNFTTPAPFAGELPTHQKWPAGRDNNINIEKETDKLLLSEYVPPSILVNHDLNIISFRGNTAPYLAPAAGKASLHLFKIVREDLVFELRMAINKVKKDSRPTRKEKVMYHSDGQIHEVTIKVAPVRASKDKACYLIIFNPLSIESKSAEPGDNQDAKDRKIARLERKLKEAAAEIKSMSEEYETTREEVQSANEEVLSSNEELQSMNEELETSKEELQSTNEELITINDELQLRQLELKKNIEYADAIIRTMQEPLLVLNKAFSVSTANRAYYKLFSTNVDQVEGKSFFEIHDRFWDIAELKSRLIDIDYTNQHFSAFKVEKEFPRGEKKVLMLNANQMHEEGKRSKILITVEDVTKRTEMEREKDDFISIASHELKTPVTSIKLFAEMIEEVAKEKEEKEMQQLAGRLNKQLNRLIHLIEELLDMNRVSKGSLQYEEKEFDLNEVIDQRVDDMQTIASKHQLKKVLKPLPKVFGDPVRIGQVLVNLISNAIKYSPDADQVIISSGSGDNNMVEVTVRDFGIGIPQKMQKEIFERFKRTNRSKRSFAGLGLGLYISSEIINRHGGTLKVNIPEGKGTKIVFTLPVHAKKGKTDNRKK